MKNTWGPTAISIVAVVGLGSFAIWAFRQQQLSQVGTTHSSMMSMKAIGIGALGELVPEDGVRRLGAPLIAGEQSARVMKIMAEEGDTVSSGDVLAIMDSHTRALAEQRRLTNEIEQLRRQFSTAVMMEKRYEQLQQDGAYPIAELERRRLEIQQLETQIQSSIDRLNVADADLERTLMRAPLNGTVLNIHARAGEKPQQDGIMELADLDNLIARLEVYEGDARRISVGSKVLIRSEDGAFDKELTASVYSVVPQIRSRQVPPTSAPADLDKRVVVVKARFTLADKKYLRSYSGAKLVGRFL